MASGGGFIRRVFMNGIGGTAMAGSRSMALRKTAAGIVKASATSGCLMAVGDGIRQVAVITTEPATKATSPAIPKQDDIRAQLSKIDVEQMARFGLIGAAMHGPWFFFGLRWIDATYGPSKSIGTAFAKTMTGQCCVFPPYLAGFFYAMGALEGKDHRARCEKLTSGFGPAYAAGCVFWPCANMINFSFLSSGQQRILYINCVGLIWNTVLSFITATRTS